MKEGRDICSPLLDEASDNSVAEIMDSEDPLFILYTRFDRKTERNGSHHRWLYGFMPTFKNVFNYEENDIFWCTADIGLQVILIFCILIERSNNSDFEGVPSYPDFSRFGKLSRNIK
jgi:acetyl-CoA synthetase